MRGEEAERRRGREKEREELRYNKRGNSIS
jgi:hypothetical protein